MWKYYLDFDAWNCVIFNIELSGITPPKFVWEDTHLLQQWERLKRHIELIFNGPLKEKDEEEKIALLLLWIGEKGRELHAKWTGISADDAKKLDTYYKIYKTVPNIR